MIAVIFEVVPNSGKKDAYLGLAEELRSALEKMPGFISIERFQSISNPGKILSLSFWNDEESISKWRNLEIHRAAQTKGRQFIFEDYRLRIASVVRDYGMFNRTEAPGDSLLFHDKSA
ncbi:MAG: antibiotic biosynthesis monooxygenase [Bacteroidetes bacterium]|nr:MAG: antibiotic biosynthesis monooxygenase [Bacteroidota bacterium]